MEMEWFNSSWNGERLFMICTDDSENQVVLSKEEAIELYRFLHKWMLEDNESY